MQKLFGTDGIRTKANTPPLDPASIVKLGQAIARYFLKDGGKHTVLIGKDTRLSGYMIEYSLSAGLTSAGANVYLTGPLPTAGVSYLTHSMRADAGIMVSASHNPYEDNGIKIFAADGFKLPDQTEDKIAELFHSDLKIAETVEPRSMGRIQRIDDAAGRYIVFLKNFFPRDLKLEGMKIGLDCANGAAYRIAPAVFDELGAQVVTRGVSPSGRNINSGFGSLYPEVVSKLVVEQNLSVGFAFDGDSDRAVVIDEKGQIISGDKLLAIIAMYYESKGMLKKNTLVSTVMSNLALDNYLENKDIKLLRTQVGDRYVLERLQNDQLNFGGEDSGHIIFLDEATCGDGILTAIKVLEVMLRSGKPLSQLCADFEPFPRKLVNLPVEAKPELSSISGYGELLSEAEGDLGSDGRVFIRYSGTENKVRILVEAKEESQCNKWSERFSDFLSSRQS